VTVTVCDLSPHGLHLHLRGWRLRPTVASNSSTESASPSGRAVVAGRRSASGAFSSMPRATHRSTPGGGRSRGCAGRSDGEQSMGRRRTDSDKVGRDGTRLSPINRSRMRSRGGLRHNFFYRNHSRGRLCHNSFYRNHSRGPAFAQLRRVSRLRHNIHLSDRASHRRTRSCMGGRGLGRRLPPPSSCE
jgi:hypothetical protein